MDQNYLKLQVAKNLLVPTCLTGIESQDYMKVLFVYFDKKTFVKLQIFKDKSADLEKYFSPLCSRINALLPRYIPMIIQSGTSIMSQVSHGKNRFH